MGDLKLSLVQPDTIWGGIGENLRRLTALIEQGISDTDLLLLPEMFATGFMTEPFEHSQQMDGEAVRWMKEVSAQLNCALAGSLIISEGGHYYNRLLIVQGEESVRWYDKRHLFTPAGEDMHYTRGQQMTIITLKGWRVAFQICYDLRFPVWSRNRNDYDLIVYSANWPAKRSAVWNTLLKARAIENQAYVAGVNRTGIDGNQISYAGESQVINSSGEMIASLGSESDITATVSLSLDELFRHRETFPVWRDGDRFTIHI